MTRRTVLLILLFHITELLISDNRFYLIIDQPIYGGIANGRKGYGIQMPEISLSPALVWTIIGLLLLVAELATISFILCFLGLGALIVALTTWFGLTSGFNSQLIVFSVSSLLLTSVLRKTAKKLFAGHSDLPPDNMGQKVRVVKAIPPGREGAIEYRSSDWIAFSDEKDMIGEGKTVEIIAIEGIHVKVKSVV